MSTNPERRVSVETITYPTDARGLVLEPLHAAEFAFQRNAHLVLTAPGGIRGNHYHREGDEVMVVLGPAFVRYRDGGGVVDREVAPGEAVRFDFPAGVSHAIQNTGESSMIIISFNTAEHHRDRPDVVRDVLIDPS